MSRNHSKTMNTNLILKTTAQKMSLAILATGLFYGNTAQADTVAVVPSEYTDTAGTAEIGEAINGYSSSTGQTLQYVIPASYLTGLADQNLTGLAFRLNNNYAPDLPQIDYSDFTIQLSTFTGDTLSSTFADNLVDPATVRSGAFSFDAGAFPTGATGTTPNGFGDFITFQNTYDYTGGNLLVTLRHAQPTGAEESSYWSVDAYSSGFAAAIGHDAGATTADTLWDNSPITEFTTSPLTANGIVATPEPSTLALAGMGAVGSLMLFRRRHA
jgi:hypothetical protein